MSSTPEFADNLFDQCAAGNAIGTPISMAFLLLPFRSKNAWLVGNYGVKVMTSGQPSGSFVGPNCSIQTVSEVREYCLIVEGAYLSESEAEHALRDPFIEDWVEQTGSFKIHNMNEILIAPGVTLGSLGVVMLDERLFEIASTDPEHPLTEHKAKGVAEALRRQDMFDEINTEPREEV
jgi:hypothetical protein